MSEFASEPWFNWSLGLIVLLPLAVIILSEVHLRLSRSGNALAPVINRVRIWLLPLVGLLVLLTQASGLDDDNSGVRVVATLVGFIAVATALAGLNAALFGNATEGTWRDRLPSIFIDLARLILIVTGGAIVASLVWGYNVGGLFAALGVGSIVIGLALQTAIGSVVSGLLLLFEQPFKIGDTLDVGGVKGKVVEMNWRSTHIDIGSGIQIIPNATIAGASFTNLSRPTPAHDLVVEVSFDAADPPHLVTESLLNVARGLGHLRPGASPAVKVKGNGVYAVTLPLLTAGDSGAAQSQFLSWLWYSSRRDEISLDGATFSQRPRADVVAALQQFASTLEITPDDIESMADDCEIEAFGQGEVIVWEGAVPRRFSCILSGIVKVTARATDGASVLVSEQDRGEIVGTSAVLREKSPTSSEAATTVEVLQLPMSVVDRLSTAKPSLARTLNDLVQIRQRQVAQAFDAINASSEVLAPITPALIRR